MTILIFKQCLSRDAWAGWVLGCNERVDDI